MLRYLRILLAFCLVALLGACGGGGGSAGVTTGSTSPTNFKVNAPAEVALAIGQKVSFTISGGQSPYLLNNSAPGVVSAAIVNGNLEITPLANGSAVVTVSPTGGSASYSVTVTVSNSVNPLQVQAPDTVILRVGNAGSYVILGGLPPYRAVSSAPAVASASVSGGTLQVVAGAVAGAADIEIFDASSAGPVKRTFNVVLTSAFFTSAPPTLAMGTGTSRSFAVSGGVAPYFVASSDASVADASVASGSLNIVAGSASNGTTSLVLRDSAGSAITVVVSVGSNAALFSNAPNTLTIQGGQTRTFTLGGGKAPYAAVSGNANIVTASVSGSTLTLNAQNKGTAAVRLTDAAGAFISIDVTVDQGSAFAVAAIELTTTVASISSAGQEATISALVKGASNAGVPNADIIFSSDSGILLAPSAQTDASGVATVRLAAGSNRTNRNIVVTARVSGISQTLTVAVTGSKILISSANGSSALQIAGTVGNFTARALDSGGNPIAGLSLNASSLSLNNLVLPASAVTDVDGNASFAYTPTNAGSDTLRVRSTVGGTNTDGILAISVSPVKFDFIDPTFAASTQFGVNQTVVCVSSPEAPAIAVRPPLCKPEFRVNLKVNGVPPVPERAVTFSTTRGTLSSSVVTTVGGVATVNLTSASAGDALVTAQVARLTGDPGTGTVLAAVSRAVSFTGVRPNSVRIQANPTSISPNAAGSSSNKAEISATVTDDRANPVSGRQVNFSITADPSNGRLSGGAVTTDSDGVARIQYFAGPNSSPTNGVTIQATVPPVNGDITALVTDGVGSNPSPARLTVAGNALFITIGLSNTIDNVVGDPSTYRKPFSVYVTDASGLAVPNQVVSLSVIPTQYRKGRLAWNGVVWNFQSASADPVVPLASPTATCPSEDQFFNDGRRNNGILETGEDGPANPNGNGDGRLTPGNVVIAAPPSVTTDSSGLAAFNLLYGEQYAKWVDVDVVATATVSGTESRSILSFALVGLAEDFNNETISPAAAVSPFGVGSPCSDRN